MQKFLARAHRNVDPCLCYVWTIDFLFLPAVDKADDGKEEDEG